MTRKINNYHEESQLPFDVAIIGGGIAGLSVALRLPEQARVALFTKGQFGESNTRYAQGGLAVALGADDHPELHFQDTIAAGAGLCNEEAVRILVEQAPAAVRWLMQIGVQFDRAYDGENAHMTPDGLLLGREGAHCRWRVLHAGGDATGAEIERALMVALRTRPSITLYEKTMVHDLLVQDGHCVGLQVIDQEGQHAAIYAHATVLASGGAGGLWQHTSNPAGATADGLAVAWRAGATLVDLEFMQFHPTVLGSSHLISEAVRGEGAYLRNHAGERFMPNYSQDAELAPRDVVARAILQEMIKENTDCQYLDLRHLLANTIHSRFPTISALCQQYGLDLVADLLPIAPAAHYCMGGVLVDTYGRTTLPNLYAVGEVACTGVHGANRLASNSLLEGLVYGIRVADALTNALDIHDSSLPLLRTAKPGADPYREVPELQGVKGAEPIPLIQEWQMTEQAPIRETPFGNGIRTDQRTRASEEQGMGCDLQQVRDKLRRIMWQYVSLCRDQDGLFKAHKIIQELQKQFLYNKNEDDLLPSERETWNMLQIAELIIIAALQRQESRGSHWRSDYPSRDENLAKRHFAFQNYHTYCSYIDLSPGLDPIYRVRCNELCSLCYNSKEELVYA